MTAVLYIAEEHRRAIHHNPHRPRPERRPWWPRIRQGPRETKTPPRRPGK